MNVVDLVELPQRHAFTAEEYLRMGDGLVFAPDARLELIEGEVIEMAPIGSPHAGTVNRLIRLLVAQAGDRAIVSVQNPIVMSDLSVPQPDLALLKPREDYYSRSHPTAADTLLAVEVSDTTLALDLEIKAPLYARCGVIELWVVDIHDKAIRVHRDPGASGYRTSFTAAGDDHVASVALPGVQIGTRDLFMS